MKKIKLFINKAWAIINEKSYYKCDECKETDIREWHKYCSNCGAEIVWDHIVKSYEVKK